MSALTLTKPTFDCRPNKTNTRLLCTYTLIYLCTHRYRGEEDESSRYTKHLDNGNSNGRRVTAIYYLNEGWKRPHGGSLRLYAHTEGGDEVYTDCEPLADRLVLFLSDARTPHEVLPTHRDRLAVTVWFYDPIEKRASNDKENAESAAKAMADGVVSTTAAGDVSTTAADTNTGTDKGQSPGEEEEESGAATEATVFSEVEHQQKVDQYLELD